MELGEANVLLVNDVDRAGGGHVVGTLRIPPDVPVDDGTPRVDGILRRSPEILSFLRCDVALPGGKGQASIGRLCDQVRGRE